MFFLSLYAYPLLSQDTIHLFKSPVEDIMTLTPKKSDGILIESASKQAESIFRAPTAASVVSREEIINAGCMSIMEALRLLPGLIVRETTNGNYDINIRGLNNTPPGSDFYNMDNTNSLVMIDYRPIYNYFSGGTFWEALPIDIQDVERIELIRGPVAALYGTNAVTGVIHIITRRANKDGSFTRGNVEYGNQNTLRLNTAAGYSWGTKGQFTVSGNLTQRDRFTSEFYDILGQHYTNTPENILSWQTGGEYSFDSEHPHPEKGIDRFGINGFATYSPQSNLNFDLSFGLENSFAVRTFTENTYTPHSAMVSKSRYINSRNQLKEGVVQFSYLGGDQEPGVNTIGSHFKFNIVDALTEYNFSVKNLKIKPGISYRRTLYDDSPYFSDKDSTNETGLINGRKSISNIATSLRFDYALANLRLVAAGRMDKFSSPNRYYFSYQLALNYSIKDKHLLRFVIGRSNRGSTLIGVFAAYRNSYQPDQPFPGAVTVNRAKGNPDIKLMESKSIEIGYRYQPSEKVFFDLEAFRTSAKDFNSVILGIEIDTALWQGTPAIFIAPTFRQTNLDLQALQYGATFSVHYSPTQNLYFKALATLQTTQITNFSPFYVTPEVNPDFNIHTQSELSNYKGTPGIYGGFYINYAPIAQLNLNLNAYYFSAQEITHASDAFVGREPTVAHIQSKVLLNLNIGFKPNKNLRLFANLRNILGQESYEYYFTDPVKRTYTGGMNYEF